MKVRTDSTPVVSNASHFTAIRNTFRSSLAALLLTAILAVANTTNAASAVIAAATTTDYVYLYENGQLVLQPTDYVQDGSVYTDLQVLVGTVDPVTDNVLDDNDDVIGLIASDGTP